MIRPHRSSPTRIAPGILLLIAGCTPPAAPTEPEPPTVQVELVRKEQIAPQAVLSGTVVPIVSSQVASTAAGQLIAMPVEEGAFVKQGDILAELRSDTVKIELEGARATLREKEEYHKELKAGYRTEERRGAEAAMLAAEADHRYTTAKLRRVRGLNSRKAATDDELELAESDAQRATQAYAEAQAAYDLKSSGYRPEEIARAQAVYEGQKQEVLRLEDLLGKHRVTAPFDGFVVEKHSDVGQWVEEGGAVVTLVNLLEVDVVVHLEESMLLLAQVGQTVSIHFDALPDEEYTGNVHFIVPKSAWEGGSRSFPVKIRVTNALGESGMPKLKEGMLARVLFQGKKHEALLAHKDSIVRSSGSPTVYRVNKEGRVQPVPVAEGMSHEEWVEVSGPLSPGQRLVTEGNERVRPAQLVRILNDER